MFVTSNAVISAEEISEDLFFGDIPVVLTATRIHQPLKSSPASITVIDRDMIEASGARIIPELMRLVPGFQVGMVTGWRYTASYHGVADQYARDMQVLIDGRSVYDPTHGGVSWSDLPISIEDIQRIEVIRGPNAAAFGSNSFAGIINIITEHPSSQQGVTTAVTVGGGRTRNLTARFADRMDKLDYRLTVSYDDGDGFNNKLDNFDTRKVDFRGDYNLSESDRFLVKMGYSNGLREDGVTTNAFNPERTVDTSINYQQFRWNRQLASDNEFSIQFYHNYQLNRDFYELPSPYTGLWVGLSHLESHRLDLEFQHNLTLGKDWKIAWGLGARHDRGKSLWLMGSDDWISRDQVRAFINAEKPLTERLTLNLGGMIEKFEDKERLFSPRLALNFHADRQNTFRIASSRAYRMPTIVDQHAQVYIYDNNLDIATLGTTLPVFYHTVENLRPQKMESFEIGYIGTFPKMGMTLDAKLFREEITDVITTAKYSPSLAPGLYDNFQFVNGGFYTLSGYELELNWKPSPNILLHAGFSHIDLDGATQKVLGNPLVDVTSTEEPVSKHMFNLLGSYRFSDGLKLSAAYYRTAQLEWNGDGDPIPDTTRATIRVSKPFRLNGFDGETSLSVENIGMDEADFDDDNLPETRLYLQAKMNWH
ncbi:MAG: TonB-dependent receptor [Sedimenticola sp.]